ncbi:MAG: hypothetical protein ABR884_02010 [Minisyncoccia bacterium]|jgi:hypothetical protein
MATFLNDLAQLVEHSQLSSTKKIDLIAFLRTISEPNLKLIWEAIRDDPKLIEVLSTNYESKRFLSASDTEAWEKAIVSEEEYLSKLKE